MATIDCGIYATDEMIWCRCTGAHMHGCVRACVRVCVRVCVHVRVFVFQCSSSVNKCFLTGIEVNESRK